MTSTKVRSQNFGFLFKRYPLMVEYAAKAERECFEDPNTALIKLRQLTEMIAKEVVVELGLQISTTAKQVTRMQKLFDRGAVDARLQRLFKLIRLAGNDATHDFTGSTRDALQRLEMAHQIAIWFHTSFTNQQFKAPAFVRPKPPKDRVAEAQAELAAVKAQLEEEKQRAAEAEERAAIEESLRQAAEAEQRSLSTDLDTAMELASESERLLEEQRLRHEARLELLSTQESKLTKEEIDAKVARSLAMAGHIEFDEAATRNLIDAELRAAGWEADSEQLRAKNTQPEPGRNLAIAEWPTASGPADYVLFRGLTPIAVVEAKRQAKRLDAVIDQALRYSRDIDLDRDDLALDSPGGPWDGAKIPFLFAANGRTTYHHQHPELSGIWTLDARRATNLRRATDGWPTPDGLFDRLRRDEAAADAALAAEGFVPNDLRDYQQEAIRKTEAALAEQQRAILLAMATGTGKTRTALWLIYRLIKHNRFRRVLFLTDRRALAKQAQDTFKEHRLEEGKTFKDIYEMKELGDIQLEGGTRLHVATVQALVKRLLYSDEAPPSIDAYDCIIVDECHRGYNLDREMSEDEIHFRSLDDYLSKYRRVLDHFDAVRIGLTATPAPQTMEIFGRPVHTYSYRQAVIDNHLIDHEPPVRLFTLLAEHGIHWAEGEEVEVLVDPAKGQIDLFNTPDEIDFRVEDFNRKVQTENFNRAICAELAQRIDPSLPGKTLIFCVNVNHASLVTRLLKEAFENLYGEVRDDAVRRITGDVDQYMQRIAEYKNESMPAVAVTVDLLTTGIDVPQIINLVFLRRVKSRILYDQMVGRATRKCNEIGKEFFNIYDAVDLYSTLGQYSDMKPVSVNPTWSFTRLVDELRRFTDESWGEDVTRDILLKLQRKRRLLEEQPKLAHAFEDLAGQDFESLIEQLKVAKPSEAVQLFAKREALLTFLDRRFPRERQTYISHHEDEVTRIESGYGPGVDRPEDFLEAFKRFLLEEGNRIPALIVVTQRPRELTVQQLRELKLALDEAGYPETHLRAAWRETTQEDIAASIIGFIRQQALGSPLRDYASRVRDGIERLKKKRRFSRVQNQWLDRLGQQLIANTVLDRELVDRGPLREYGGAKRYDHLFDGELDTLLGDLQEEIWRDSA